jgi:hypothetical protein
VTTWVIKNLAISFPENDLNMAVTERNSYIFCTYIYWTEILWSHIPSWLSQKKVYVVRRHGCKFECNRDCLKKVLICCPVLVIADNTYSVFDFLKSRSYDPSKAVERHISPSSGEKWVKKPRKGKQKIFKTPIETKIARLLTNRPKRFVKHCLSVWNTVWIGYHLLLEPYREKTSLSKTVTHVQFLV